MTIEELNNRIEKAQIQLFQDHLQWEGYKVVLYIYPETLLAIKENANIWLRPYDNFTEGCYKGCKFYVVSTGSEQVLVAKEIV